MHFRDATIDGLIKVRDAYPFGLDPVWHGSRSELPFLNSLKMKMSILLGVAQMNLGIMMSFCNATFFRSCVDIWYVLILDVSLVPSVLVVMILDIICNFTSYSDIHRSSYSFLVLNIYFISYDEKLCDFSFAPALLLNFILLLQVPICSSDHFFKQFVWLSLLSHCSEMVHWL